MSVSSKYYQLLGIHPGASPEEIRKAYRRKAKMVHPDSNKSESAHQEFLQLTEAYNFLSSTPSYSPPKASDRPLTEAEMRAYRREQARRYAEAAQEAYKRTPKYQREQAFKTMGAYLHYILSLVILTSPLIGFFLDGIGGLIGGIAFTAISAPIWIHIFRKPKNLGWSKFNNAAAVIVQTAHFKYGFTTGVNILVFFNNTLYTEVRFIYLFLLLNLLMLISWILIKFNVLARFKMKSKDLFLVFVPTVFNLIFFLNFYISFNPSTEKYWIINEHQLYGLGESKLERISIIELQDGRYQSHPWFRTFSFEAMPTPQTITYTFNTGIFGMRVLKNYKFTEASAGRTAI